MANNIIPRAMATDVIDDATSASFLPKVYRSDANKKFLHSTINQLTQSGQVKKVSGYIGRTYSKSTTADDVFVEAPTTNRQNYQLEPGFVINDTLDNTTFLKDYQDYINQLRVFGANVSNHSRLNKQEFYSWNPHINWDKFVNFQNYYWMPYGPNIITIQNSNNQPSVSTYNVLVDTNETGSSYVFSPDGITKNPVITLYRGQTYKFNIDSPGNTFSIKVLRTAGPLNRYVHTNLINNAIENGQITFTIPDNAPNELVYVSENDIDMGGVFNILDLSDTGYINVDAEIIGKRAYIFKNVPLSNGMKIQFAGNVYPTKYATGRYYVEGVGDAIQLINEKDLEIITSYTSTESMLFDTTLFDTTPFSDSTSYITQPDYIVINRDSNDKNFWCRNNKWVHKDVIEASALLNGTHALYDQSARAVRPIIEFEKNLKLFNFGTQMLMDISVIDTHTVDAFSIVEGSLGYNVDGVNLTNGQTIIFTADKDNLVKDNIYRVEFLDVLHEIATRKISQSGIITSVTAVNSGWTATITGLESTVGLNIGATLSATSGTGKLFSGSATATAQVTAILSSTSVQYTIVGGSKPKEGTITNIITNLDSSRQIRLVLVNSPVINQVVLVQQGTTSQGKMYWYNGSNWVLGQQKTKSNQIPLFDVVDIDRISFGDKTVYPGTTFNGTSVFSYKVGSGKIDNNLGFALSYKNINNIGDIVFNFGLINDTFTYELSGNTVSKTINTGYLIKTINNTTKYVNGWEISKVDNPQAAIRVYRNSNIVNNFNIDIFDTLPSLSDIDIRVYVNNIRVTNWEIKSQNVINDQIAILPYHQIVFNADLLKSDVVLIKVYSLLPINTNGYYEIPINLQNNSFNGTLNEFTLGEVIDHVGSIVDNVYNLGFSGDYPGVSNLRDMGPVSNYGTKFIQHSGPLSLSLYHITSDNNIVQAIEQTRDDYCKFKKSFLTIASTMGIDTETVNHVDLILQDLFKDTPNTAPYYFSDMAPYGAKNRVDFTVSNPEDNIFSLSTVFNLNELSSRAVNIYLNETQLIHGKEYTFNDQGFVLVSAELITGDIISVFEYDSTDGCLIPETPTKLGLWPKYEPKKYLDTTLIQPQMMIQGHDGSLTVAYNDYRDDLILELETRIYNNLKIQYNSEIFDLVDIIPSYSRITDYSLKEYNDILMPNFNKWAAAAGVDFSTVLNYDETNSFTFNYSNHTAPNGQLTPAYWRGIYQWMYDTDRPHICPWEMIGYSEEPSWWVEVYGPAPYTSNNLILWSDISQGLIKEPNKKIKVRKKYIKDFLLKYIPVDEDGNLISPYDSGLAQGYVRYSKQGDFSFGDISPIETAWRRNSHYAFSVLKSVILMQPSKTIGTLFDRSRVIKNDANQFVYLDTGIRISPAAIKFPSVYLSNIRIQTSGLINFLINNIDCTELTAYNKYKTDLESITSKLCYRVSAFTSKEKFNLLLDSKSPTAVGSIFIPQEDYKVVLNASSPISILTYSGVIITKVSNGFEIKGYSQLQPFFNYYIPVTPYGHSVNVGGISEAYSTWDINRQYITGNIVLYMDKFYRVLEDHVSTFTFEIDKFFKLKTLPIIGGVDAVFKTQWSRTSQTMQYGTRLESIQAVVDFLIGYGEWLKIQGFIFDEFNAALGSITNWETSAKEFMFWSAQNWTSPSVTWTDWLIGTVVNFGDIVHYNGEFYKALKNMTLEVFNINDFQLLNGVDLTGNSVISVSPAAKKLVFNTVYSVIDDINNPRYTYEILDENGKPILTHFLNTFRVDNAVTYSPRDNVGIYCASFYLIQREHVVVLNNTTMFNDTIYNLESGYKQDKIKVSGYVSIDWNGSFNVPGFIVDQAKINDWTQWKEYSAGDIVKHTSFYYSAIRSLAGSSTFDNTQWVKLRDTPSSKLLPNWNYKASQFTDFYSLDSENFDTAQQHMAQHLIGYQKRQYLENIIQDDVSEYKFYQGMIIEKGTQNVLNKLFDVLSAEGQESLNFYEEWAIRTGQYGASSAFENIEFTLPESSFKVNPQGFELVNSITEKSDIVIQQVPTDIYVKPINYNSNVWPQAKNIKTSTVYARIDEVTIALKSIDDLVALDSSIVKINDYVLCTFAPSEWNVYQYVSRTLSIIHTEHTDTGYAITVSNINDIQLGTIILLTNVNSDGFYIVNSVNGNIITIDTKNSLTFIDTSNIPSIFVSRRIKQTINYNNYKIDDLSPGSLLWTDNDSNLNDFYNDTSNWKVWKYNPVYNRSIKPSLNSYVTQYGRSAAVTKNGKIIAISAVTTENVDAEGIIMIYNNSEVQGWVLSQAIIKPFKHSDFEVYDYTAVGSVVAISPDGVWLVLGSPTADMYKQGAISIYKIDASNVYSLWITVISSNPSDNEQFGHSITIGTDVMYIGTKAGNVYQILYKNIPYVTAVYKSVGSQGTTLVVSSTTGIEEGMLIAGKGFDNQVVSSIIDNTTLSISQEPSDIPAGIITFSKYEWQHETVITGETNKFGSAIALSESGVLVISEPYTSSLGYGSVTIYPTLDLINPIQIAAPENSRVFGKAIAISDNADYIAISSLIDNSVYEGTVNVYQFSDNPVLTQTLVSAAINVSGEFGSSIQFKNDYTTLVIGHAITPVVMSDITFSDNTTFSTFVNAIYSSSIDIFDRYDTKWMFSEQLKPLTIDNSEKYGSTVIVTTNSVIVGAPAANNVGQMYDYTTQLSQFSWTVKNKVIAKPDITKVKQAFMYNKRTNTLVKYLDVVDSIQHKHPIIADQEVKYKFAYDPAVYTVGTNLVNVDEGIAWTYDQVGTLWWDLRTTKFVDNFTDSVIYRNSMLGNLAVGASVDIYEWVESTILPSQWDILADTETGLALDISGKSLYGDSVYSEIKQYDTLSQTFSYTYFFWVKNKSTISPGRTISALSISQLIGNPKGAGYEYLALTGLNSFSLVNVKPLLSNDDIVLSVEYWTGDRVDQNIHTQWKLISTATTSIIPTTIEQKWFDSLCGKDIKNRLVPDQLLPLKLRYGIENRPRQGMFVNRFEALKQVIEQTNISLKSNLITDTRNLSNLKKYDVPPAITQGLYDVVFDTDAELQYAVTKYFKQAILTAVVVDGKISNVIITDSGKGYIVAPTVKIYGNGSDAVVKTIINNSGQITGVTIINPGVNYTGTVTLIVRSYSILISSDSTSNGKWSIYSYITSTSTWFKSLSYTYDVTKYWNYIDWYATGVNQFTAINHSVSTYADLYQLDAAINDTVKVRVTNSGWVLLQKYANSTDFDWTQTYKIIGSENGTIQFSSLLYNFANTAIGYDGSIYDAGVYDNYADIELRIILNAIKNDLLIDDLKDSFLQLFFTSVRYALTEQTYIDWIFKTSLVNVMHNVGKLRQLPTYKNDNLSNFEDYVSEVKPYKTQVREYISAYNNIEQTNTGISDFDLPSAYDIDTKQLEVVDSNNPKINTYPWKTWLDNVGYMITEIKVIDAGSEYVSAPIVNITSNTGSGATATAFIANNRVSRITVVTKGSGYLETPMIELVGGYSSSGTPAKATAVLGNSVIRTNKTKIKFDRIYQDYIIDDLQYTEQLSNITGTKVQFTLKWIPDITIGKTTVTINGVLETRDNYTLGTISSMTNGHLTYTGVITFKTAPVKNSVIIVNYYKNNELLTATDRIHYYYEPTAGEIGKDLPQLMAGIDYGGVTVGGLNFDVVHGWDSVPYYADTWDNFDPNINDVKITVGAEFTYDIKLPYMPDAGTRFNVYYSKVSQATVRLDDPIYQVGIINPLNVHAVMATPVATGFTDIIELPSSIAVNLGDTIIVRKETSDGSIATDYDTLLSGGSFTMGSAAGLNIDDVIVDGDDFYSSYNSYGPEEVVPGQVVDTLAIKVFTTATTGAYMQFKDLTNKVQFSRLNNAKKTQLVKPLYPDDTTIIVADSSHFAIANIPANIPGVIDINGERIEYFGNDNNVLSDLRRGTLGTGVSSVHKVNSVVQNIGYSETLPYSDTVKIDQFISDGSTILNLSYIPSKSKVKWKYMSGFTSIIPTGYGQTDDIEIFVGGYNDNAVWESNMQYTAGQIVKVGVYTYKCIQDHTSSSDFKLDRSNWSYFIGNIRLRKAPYTVHNINIDLSSPLGDVQFEADFSVTGKARQVRLTYPVTPGTMITVIRKTGSYWPVHDAKIVEFLNAVPGSTYTPPVI